MRCRTMQDGTIIWFGSIGKNDDGTAIFANEEHNSFSDTQEGVATSLEQRLSVLKGELWYSLNYGIPLIDKLKSKTEMDMHVMRAVRAHQDVVSVDKFTSTIENSKYRCNMTVVSKFGSLEVSI